MATVISKSDALDRLEKMSGLNDYVKDDYGKTRLYYAALGDSLASVKTYVNNYEDLGDVTKDEYEALSPDVKSILEEEGYELIPKAAAVPKTPIYLLMGHGTVNPDVPPIPVPEGVIWIESAVCGEEGRAGDESILVTQKRKVQQFFDETPMPTTNEEKVAYRKRFNVLLKAHVYSIKFPGEPIYAGANTLFSYFPGGFYRMSGIIPLQEFTRADLTMGLLKQDKGPILANATLSEMFSKSIYPTKAKVLEEYEEDDSPDAFAINYLVFLKNIASGKKTYGIAKPSNETPVVLLNVACRATSAGPNRRPASLMRTHSFRRNANVLGTMTKEELTDPRSTELGNRLMFYITHRQVERVEEYLKQLERVMPTAAERSAFLEAKIDRRRGDPASAMDLVRIGFQQVDGRNESIMFNSSYKGPRDRYIEKMAKRLDASVRDDGGYTKAFRKMAVEEEEEEYQIKMESIRTELASIQAQSAEIDVLLEGDLPYEIQKGLVKKSSQLARKETALEADEKATRARHRTEMARLTEELESSKAMGGTRKGRRIRRTTRRNRTFRRR